MEKKLNTLNVRIPDILMNGRVLDVGTELVVDISNNYKHLFVGHKIHYEYVFPYYKVMLNLYDNSNEQYELHIYQTNDHCTRACTLKKKSAEYEEDIIGYPFIANTNIGMNQRMFAIFDIHSNSHNCILRDYPFESNYKDSNNKLLFRTYYDYEEKSGRDIVVMLKSFDVIDDEIVNPKFSMDLNRCYVSEQDYINTNKQKVTIEVVEGEPIETIMKKVQKEFEKLNNKK